MTKLIHRYQAPRPGSCTLDHAAFFVADMDEAETALYRLGFFLSPFTKQMHRSEPGADLTPAGTGNRLAVFEQGYLEILAPTGEDTPLADQHHAALARYAGLHLIAFGSADAGAHRARLVADGFAPQPVVDLRREVTGADGRPAEVRFRVTRVPPGTMEEGRVQFCEHVTPAQVWRDDWLAHPNGIIALDALWICTADPDAAAARYARFTGCRQSRTLRTARGALRFMSEAEFTAALPDAGIPALPFIGALCLRCRSLPQTRAALRSRGVPVTEAGGRLVVDAADGLGATLLISENAA